MFTAIAVVLVVILPLKSCCYILNSNTMLKLYKNHVTHHRDWYWFWILAGLVSIIAVIVTSALCYPVWVVTIVGWSFFFFSKILDSFIIRIPHHKLLVNNVNSHFPIYFTGYTKVEINATYDSVADRYNYVFDQSYFVDWNYMVEYQQQQLNGKEITILTTCVSPIRPRVVLTDPGGYECVTVW